MMNEEFDDTEFHEEEYCNACGNQLDEDGYCSWCDDTAFIAGAYD